LLALGGATAVAAPAPDRSSSPAGEWLHEDREDESCAIFQQGRVLLVVNEHGDLATARLNKAKKFTVKGWEDGVAGELAEEGKEIIFTNGSTWKRP
jgi:hypothetical protein